MYEWRRQIQQIVDEIDGCIRSHDDAALTLRSLSRTLGYSEYYTTRKFREISGMQLRDYCAGGGWRLPCARCATATQPSRHRARLWLFLA